MKKFIFIFILANILLNSHSIAQVLHGTYYIVPEKCNRDSTVFTRELVPSSTPRQVYFWKFKDGILRRGWMRYTLINGVFYCPWDQQDSRRSYYEIDKDKNTINVWYSKRDKKKSNEPRYQAPILNYKPLILSYDVGSLIHGKPKKN